MKGADDGNNRWYLLLAMGLMYTLSIADRFVISTVLEPIRLELELSDAGIAFLSGVSLALFYVAFGFPLAWLADRKSRRDIIAWSILAWSAMTLCSGIARNYGQLLAARVGVGIGEAGGTPAANSILSDVFPARERPFALTLFSIGAPLGAWVAASLGGALADRWGWRSVFVALGLCGGVFAAILRWTIAEPERGRFDGHRPRVPGIVETLRFLGGQKSALHVLAGGALSALWGWGLMWWTPAFLMRSYALTAGEAGAILGPIHLAGGIGATLATAWLVSRPVLRDSRHVLYLLAAGIAVATTISGYIYWTHSLATAKALLWLFVPSIYFYIGPGFAVLNNLAEPRMRALFCAILLLAANVANLVVAPQAVGFLSDWFAAGHAATAASLRAALLCLVPFGSWAALHFLLAARTVAADERRAARSAGQDASEPPAAAFPAGPG